MLLDNVFYIAFISFQHFNSTDKVVKESSKNLKVRARSLHQENNDLPSEVIFCHFCKGGKIIKKLNILAASEVVGYLKDELIDLRGPAVHQKGSKVHLKGSKVHLKGASVHLRGGVV